MLGRMSLARRAAVLASVVLLVLAPRAVDGADRANVPLKNWGGFSLYRDALYDDLERLVTAGLTDRAILNTKPLSRLEAARIVAGAIRNIRGDSVGAYNQRRDLEPVLDRLIAELRPELERLGALRAGQPPAPAPFVAFVPVDRAQVGAAWANRDYSLINDQGRSFARGVNGFTTFESRLQFGDFLTFYVQPELLGNEDTGAARLATGYAKLTLWNAELLVGRDSLWWGPGIHGSLILSNNAAPLDQVRLQAAEPFLLPWIGEWVGPTKLLFFLAQLEARRDRERAKLAGMRGTIAPFSFLELGISRVVQFDGEDRPRLSLSDYPRVIFDPSSDPSQTRTQGGRFDGNNVLAADADLRLRNVDRFFLPARDLRLYAELGWDDTWDEVIVPAQDALSGRAGLHLIGLFGEDLDARVEYTETSDLSFNHHIYYRGYWTRGHVLSHFVGTRGRDIYSRLSWRLSSDLMLGLEVNRATIGSTVNTGLLPKERRLGGGVDLSYRFWERYSVFAQYLMTHVDNRGFRTGNDGFEHLLRLELTRTFR